MFKAAMVVRKCVCYYLPSFFTCSRLNFKWIYIMDYTFYLFKVVQSLFLETQKFKAAIDIHKLLSLEQTWYVLEMFSMFMKIFNIVHIIADIWKMATYEFILLLENDMHGWKFFNTKMSSFFFVGKSMFINQIKNFRSTSLSGNPIEFCSIFVVVSCYNTKLMACSIEDVGGY